MRRYFFLFAVGVCVCLFFFCPFVAEAKDAPYTIWGIPWGSTPKECKTLAATNAGISFSTQYDSSYLSSDKNLNLKINGVDVNSVSFSFDKSSALESIWIRIIDKTNEFEVLDEYNLRIIEDSVGKFRTICDALIKKYGNPTYSGILFGEEAKGEWTSKIPMDKGAISYDTIIMLMKQNKCVHIGVYWNNICAYFTVETESHPYKKEHSFSISYEKTYDFEGSRVLPEFGSDGTVNTGF